MFGWEGDFNLQQYCRLLHQTRALVSVEEGKTLSKIQIITSLNVIMLMLTNITNENRNYKLGFKRIETVPTS